MKKILLMIVLTIVAFFTADARNARMIMCFDIQNSAAKSKSPDIVTMDAVFALYQKTAPVLMSANIWSAILRHDKEFQERLKDDTSLEYRYHQLYEKVSLCCKEAFDGIDREQYKEDDIKKKILAEKVQECISNNKKYTSDLAELENERGIMDVMYSHDLSIVMNDFFNLAEWDIYVIDNRFVLCIPHSYKKIMHAIFNAEQSYIPKEIRDQISSVGQEEIALGLKINHAEYVRLEGIRLEDLSPLAKEMSPKDQELIQKTPYMEKLLSQIFVTKMDIPEKAHDYLYLLMPSYTFAISGHGQYTEISPELQSALQEREQLYDKIGFVRGQGGNFIDDEVMRKKYVEKRKSSIEIFNKKWAEERRRWRRKRTNVGQEEEIEAMNKKRMEEQIKNIEQLEKVEKKINNLFIQTKGVIATLSLPAFTAFSHFCNENIVTNIMYYSTCFFGGRNLQLPFIQLGHQERYNYTIISSVSSDVTAVTTAPHFKLINFTADDFIVTGETAHFHIFCFYDYKQFFELVEQDKPMKDIIKVIIDPSQHNVPAIRLPGTEWFSISKVEKITYLNKIALDKALAAGKIRIHEKMAVLLYVPYIPVELELSASMSYTVEYTKNLFGTENNDEESSDDEDSDDEDEDEDLEEQIEENLQKNTRDAKRMPLFLSMIPGDATHWIQEISVPDTLFTSLIVNMISENVVGEKIYLVDSVTAIGNFGTGTAVELSIPYEEEVNFQTVAFINHGEVPLTKKQSKKESILFFVYKNRCYRCVDSGGHFWLNEDASIKWTSDEDCKLYKKWYEEQKKKAHESADLLTDLSKVEAAAYKHIENVWQKPVSEAELIWQARKKRLIKKRGG